jgi:hypothetical protein
VTKQLNCYILNQQLTLTDIDGFHAKGRGGEREREREGERERESE